MRPLAGAPTSLPVSFAVPRRKPGTMKETEQISTSSRNRATAPTTLLSLEKQYPTVQLATLVDGAADGEGLGSVEGPGFTGR